jgi:predicted amidohydrolase
MTLSTRSFHILKILLFFAFLLIYSCQPQGRNSTGNNTEDDSGQKYSLDSVLRIALVQPEPITDPEQILFKGKKFCEEAKTGKADIVIFPEMFNIGYDPGVDFQKEGYMDAWKARGVSDSSDFVKFFRDLSREMEMAILVTFLEKWEPLPRNSAILFDRHGNRVLKYSKVHTVEIGFMEASITPGDDFYVGDLDTRLGPVKTGVMICYDREFPESARILMLKGAELILTPNACKLDHLRIVQFQSRAWENSVAVAMANYCQHRWFDGHSCAFNADGREILIAGEEEGIFYADFNLQEIREYRNWTFWGNAYRRPGKYGLILSEEVDSPFVRNDAFGRPFDRTKR